MKNEKFIIEGTVLKKYVGNEKIVTIPEGITEIGDNAFTCKEYPKDFCEVENIEEIIMPNSVKTIGWWAFATLRNLKKITISNSVKKFGGFAFENCESLTEIIFPSKMTRFYLSTFSSCKSLKKIDLSNTKVTRFESDFFSKHSLSEIILPDSLKYLNMARLYCCPSLINVKYLGTVEQWKKINKNFGVYWSNSNLKTITCTDGVVTYDNYFNN